NARGQIIGDKKGFLKLLFHEEDMSLLGVHVIGEQATELVHIGLTAMLMKGKVDLFIHTCYNYPTLSELYKYAAYSALANRAKKRGGIDVAEEKQVSRAAVATPEAPATADGNGPGEPGRVSAGSGERDRASAGS